MSEDLQQPLLDTEEEEDKTHEAPMEDGAGEEDLSVVRVDLTNAGGDGDGEDASSPADGPPDGSQQPFTAKGELAAIWALGWPMGVSYFCRMAMASTDSVFVGHYKGGNHEPGEYLAASALSDMVTTLLVVPPLAFNQVLNALCGQRWAAAKKRWRACGCSSLSSGSASPCFPSSSASFSSRTSSTRSASPTSYAS